MTKEDEILKILKQMNKRFDDIDKRFEQVDKRFEQIDERFEQIDERFSSNDEKFESIDKKFEKVDQNFIDMKKYMDTRFNELDNELIDIKRNLAVMEKEHGEKLQILLENRQDIVDKEMGNSIKIDHLTNRVEILEYKKLKV